MGTFVDNMTATASRLIQSFGVECTFHRSVESNFSPSFGDVAETISSFTAYGVSMGYNKNEVDGSVILNSDLQLWVENLGDQPLVGDTVSFDGLVYRVMGVTKYSAQGSTAVYRLQLRI